jgi:hypothetical protein
MMINGGGTELPVIILPHSVLLCAHPLMSCLYADGDDTIGEFGAVQRGSFEVESLLEQVTACLP